MSCFGNAGDELAAIIAVPKDGDAAKVSVTVNQPAVERVFSPKEVEMIKNALVCAVQMIQNADHEKISRQYREGKMGDDVGFTWFMDEPQAMK